MAVVGCLRDTMCAEGKMRNASTFFACIRVLGIFRYLFYRLIGK